MNSDERGLKRLVFGGFVMVAALGLGLQTGAGEPKRTYVVVRPGTHPGIVFSAGELPALRKRAAGGGMAGEAWVRVKKLAAAPYTADLTVKQAVGQEGKRLAEQLQAMALVYQVEGDREVGRKAVELFEQTAARWDAAEFHRVVDGDFFATEHWPKAFAYAWDWLYPMMAEEQRRRVLGRLEMWNAALFAHTESWWWRDAAYNCGAIPVGAQGILLAATRGESNHAEYARWQAECFRKIRDNYFPLTWRANGICNEGPGYAHYHQNPTLFAEAVRRLGGEDIIGSSGAVNAMHYLRHQWMPQGGCGPAGDNTEYGRRVFQPIYLRGIGELQDAAGLWTFLKYADLDRINPLWVFLNYPEGLKAESPGALGLPPSSYFEVDANRAGYVFGRSGWDDEQAHWFAFTTRHDDANHTHYDMNSFLFTAFGEQFATHANVYPYSHRHHGADIEHNMVIVDEGGMPAEDRPSAGDDGSILGFMTGVAAGQLADYARGDARLSYADRSVRGSAPAERADRTALFVKQGLAPYVVVADDIQKDGSEHDYHWQWYTAAKRISGAGTYGEPFEVQGERAVCRIAFDEPAAPEHDFRVVRGEGRAAKHELGLLRVNRRGVRARYVALAAASRVGEPLPRLSRGPRVTGGLGAASIVVEGPGFSDLIAWQPEEVPDEGGQLLAAGPLKTDALLAMVRRAPDGRILGYVMGDGTRLEYGGRVLASSKRMCSVVANEAGVQTGATRRARQGLPPLPAEVTTWRPGGAK
ncbi:MAG: hypothetical protein HY858_06030 [Candidatus Solibacter usitatus]|nr:hypothetical protein [Candidatus Solibacter usitatus]